MELALAGLALVFLVGGLGDAYQAMLREPLIDDVETYVEGARGMTRFFDTGSREPLHCLWLRVGMELWPDPGVFPRLVTAGQTVLMAVGMYLYARASLGVLTAQTALWLLAGNYSVHFYGVSGLRDPLFSTQFIWFAWAMFLPHRAGGQARGNVLASGLAVLLFLTRVYAAVQVLGACVWWPLRQRFLSASGWRAALGRSGVVLASTATVAVLDRVLRGAGHVAHDIQGFWALEKYGHYATDDMPPISLVDFLFEGRNAWDVVVLFLSNHLLFATNYLRSFAHGYAAWAPWMLLLGVVAALVTRREYLVVVAVLALAPAVLVLHINQPGAIGVDKRLVLPAFVACLPLLAHAPWFLLEEALSRLAPRVPAAQRVLGLLKQLGPRSVF